MGADLSRHNAQPKVTPSYIHHITNKKNFTSIRSMSLLPGQANHVFNIAVIKAVLIFMCTLQQYSTMLNYTCGYRYNIGYYTIAINESILPYTRKVVNALRGNNTPELYNSAQFITTSDRFITRWAFCS